MADVLDSAAIISSLPTLLPPSNKKLGSPLDAIVAILHTAMSAVSFRLIGARSMDSNVLPDEWNDSGSGDYTLRYRHDQSGLEFVMKIAQLGRRTIVNAIALEVRPIYYKECHR